MGDLNDDKDGRDDDVTTNDQEDTTTTTPAGDGQDQQEPEKGTGSDDSSKQDNSGDDELTRLRKQLKQANDESAGRRHTIRELEEKIKNLERKDMDERERLEAELSDLKGADEERTSLKEKVEALETAVKAQVEALTKALKVPAYITDLLEGMDPARQLEYLSKNSKHFQTPQKPDIDASSKGKKPGKAKQTPEERRKRLNKRIPALNRRRR